MHRYLRNNGLSLAMFGFFAVFLLGQSLTGWREYDQDQPEHGEPVVSYTAYLRTGHFVEAVFENWQSEFLAVGVLVVLSIFLRQRGSPESKPVVAHAETGSG